MSATKKGAKTGAKKGAKTASSEKPKRARKSKVLSQREKMLAFARQIIFDFVDPDSSDFAIIENIVCLNGELPVSKKPTIFLGTAVEVGRVKKDIESFLGHDRIEMTLDGLGLIDLVEEPNPISAMK